MLRQELYRFLLDEINVLWGPDQIYQEVEKNQFSFLYLPYAGEEDEIDETQSFLTLCGFLIEHADYNDAGLIDFVYKMYDKVEKNRNGYLQGPIWQDLDLFERAEEGKEQKEEPALKEDYTEVIRTQESKREDITTYHSEEEKPQKKGLRNFLDGKKKKEKQADYQKQFDEQIMERMDHFMVAEPSFYQEDVEDRTAILSTKDANITPKHYLMDTERKLTIELSKPAYIIGKAKEKCDICLDDLSVSRMHCRIVMAGQDIHYLEDLNSTNSTFLGGVKLNPYEQRELHSGDEIKCGNTVLFYR